MHIDTIEVTYHACMQLWRHMYNVYTSSSYSPRSMHARMDYMLHI